MGRICIAMIVSTFFVTVPAVAGQNASAAVAPTVTPVATSVASRMAAPTVAARDAAASAAVARMFPSRPSTLAPLYVSLSVLQGYDVYSTTTALKRGGVEANPVLKGIAKNQTALIVVKSATTAGTIIAAERLWRQDKRKTAVALLVASNALMAAVAVNNSTVLRRQR